MSESEQRQTEANIIARSDGPVTTADILTALRSAGVLQGDTIIVHSSLSRVGWVIGGARSVVDGLISAVGSSGTIVMPAQTGISDPSTWQNPPVPESWWQTIRDHWPAFDPKTTPLRAMGVVVDCFRRFPEVVHSGHPAMGFVARGPNADAIVAKHTLENSLGDSSPLARLYDLDARIVLIGVGHQNNTSLHLAEHRSNNSRQRLKSCGAPQWVNGAQQWTTYQDLDHDEGDFAEIGAAFIASGGTEQRASLGIGEVITCSMRPLVDFAISWMATHRQS